MQKSMDNNFGNNDPWAQENEIYHDQFASTYEQDIRPSNLPEFIFFYKKHLKFIQNFDKTIQILDVGAGTGDFCKDLLDLGFLNITACDISKNMLNEIKNKYPEIKTSQQDVTQLGFKNNTFDFINMKGCLHHIHNTDRALNEIFRCLKPGGVFRLQEPITRGLDKTNEDDDHLERPLNLKFILGMLKKHGFKIKTNKLFLHFQTNDYLSRWIDNKKIKNIIVKLMNPICNFFNHGDIFLIIASK